MRRCSTTRPPAKRSGEGSARRKRGPLGSPCFYARVLCVRDVCKHTHTHARAHTHTHTQSHEHTRFFSAPSFSVCVVPLHGRNCPNFTTAAPSPSLLRQDLSLFEAHLPLSLFSLLLLPSFALPHTEIALRLQTLMKDALVFRLLLLFPRIALPSFRHTHTHTHTHTCPPDAPLLCR